MARKVFFSFHYQNDIWRVNVVRNSHIVEGVASAGFSDASLWEEAKKKGDQSIKQMIDTALIGTSVTVVLIGSGTWGRKYVNYEIERSLERGNGLLGIYIHNIKDRNGFTGIRGITPKLLTDLQIPCYDWNYYQFGNLVEQAYWNSIKQKEAYKTYKANQASAFSYFLSQKHNKSSILAPNNLGMHSFLGNPANINSSFSLRRSLLGLPPDFFNKK